MDGYRDPKFDNTTPALAATRALQTYNRELKKGENYKTKRIDPPVIIETDDEDPTPFHGRRMSFTLGTYRPTAIDFKSMAKDDISENAAHEKQKETEMKEENPPNAAISTLKNIANRVKFNWQIPVSHNNKSMNTLEAPTRA